MAQTVILKNIRPKSLPKASQQVEGTDYNKTFAPVTKFNSIKLLLALAAQYDWEIHQMDVKSAFLNGELDEKIYMQPPPGYKSAPKPTMPNPEHSLGLLGLGNKCHFES